MVATITDKVSSGGTQSFIYHELGRLKIAQSQANSGTHCWGQSYGYDRYGNLTSINVTKCTAPMLSLSIDNKNRITNPAR